MYAVYAYIGVVDWGSIDRHMLVPWVVSGICVQVFQMRNVFARRAVDSRSIQRPDLRRMSI